MTPRASAPKEVVRDSTEPEGLLPEISTVHSQRESYEAGNMGDDEETQADFPDAFSNPLEGHCSSCKPIDRSTHMGTSGSSTAPPDLNNDGLDLIEGDLEAFQNWGHRITAVITHLRERATSAEMHQEKAEARAQEAEDRQIEAESRQLAAEKRLAEVQLESAQLTQKLTRIVTDFNEARSGV